MIKTVYIVFDNDMMMEGFEDHDESLRFAQTVKNYRAKSWNGVKSYIHVEAVKVTMKE